MAEVIPQINIDGTKIKNTWTEKEYVTDEVYNALNKAVIDLKNNNNLLDSNSILFREEYNSSSKNLNNAIHQGVYSFTNSAVNAPSGVTGGNLFVTNTSKINQGSSVVTQIAFCHNGAVYARTKNNSENFTSWNKLAYITDNVASATKATQDSDGNAINTTYVKKVNGTADGLTCVDDTFGGQLTVKRNSNSATTIKFTNTSNVNRYVGFTNSDKNMYKWGDSGENQTAFLDASNYNNYAPTKTGGGASGTWGINISGNATSATKATNDQNGMNISTGFLNRNRGDIPSKNFDNAYIEGLYNFGNSETNRPLDFGRLLTLNNGYNSTGSWIWQLALPIRNNNLRLRTRTNGEAWLGWRTIPFTDSPAFSGTPTAPTPSTGDNSTKIATTAFVKSLFTASKATNGWHKEASTGFIWQWGQEANYHDIMDSNYGSSGSLNFPISFPNKCLAVMPYLIGSKTFCCVSVSSFTNAKITVHWDEWAHDVQSVKFGYIAVGY